MTLSGILRSVFLLEGELDYPPSRSVHNHAARNLKERFLTHRYKLLTYYTTRMFRRTTTNRNERYESA